MEMNGDKLAWLRGLYPGYFSLTMATGIVTIATDALEMKLFSMVLGAITILSWLVLLVLYTWRLLRYPTVVWSELTNPSTTFIFFTFVAGTDIVGMILHGYHLGQLALATWLFALVAWGGLLHVSFSVLTLSHEERKANVVHGGWLICIVGTQSLVLLGVNVLDQVGEWAPSMMVWLYMLWGIGLILYAIFVTLFCYRIFFLSMSEEDYSPLMWVIMGAAAICANASSTLSLNDPMMPVLVAMHPVVDATALLAWAWASWWIPLLVVIGIWKHYLRGHPIHYHPMQWSIVFPLGMYTVTSYRLALAADFTPLHVLSHGMVWVALAAWLLVMVGMVRTLSLARRKGWFSE